MLETTWVAYFRLIDPVVIRVPTDATPSEKNCQTSVIGVANRQLFNIQLLLPLFHFPTSSFIRIPSFLTSSHPIKILDSNNARLNHHQCCVTPGVAVRSCLRNSRTTCFSRSHKSNINQEATLLQGFIIFSFETHTIIFPST